jgi:copper oxidase (laccase) domain-containing protein
MENIGANRQDIVTIIGPTIQKKSYEIKEDVAKIVKDNLYFKKNHSILFHIKNDRYLFDLPLLLKTILKSSGINEINDVNINTYEKNNLFFSHRHSSHKNFPKVGITGRHVSVIGILK